MQILAEIGDGDPQAGDRLLPSVYDELRQLAHRKLADERSGLTLQTTALVHEAYLRLVGQEHLAQESRRYFFGAAAEAMRRILIERARKYRSQKHGGGTQRVPLHWVDVASAEAPRDDVVALDQALRKLEAEDPAPAEVLKLRYFAGLSVEETARVLALSPAAVKRRSTFGRAWICREMKRQDESIS